jgi:hypothetical protein
MVVVEWPGRSSIVRAFSFAAAGLRVERFPARQQVFRLMPAGCRGPQPDERAATLDPACRPKKVASPSDMPEL